MQTILLIVMLSIAGLATFIISIARLASARRKSKFNDCLPSENQTKNPPKPKKSLTTFERIQNVILENFPHIVKDEIITECIRFREDLGFDSLDMINLAIGLQNEFCVQITDEEFGSKSLRSINDAIRLIEDKLEWAIV